MPYNAEQKKQFDKNAGYDHSDLHDLFFEIEKKVNKFPETINGQPVTRQMKLETPADVREDYKRAGFAEDRTNTHVSLFYFYLMGEKKMSLSQAVALDSSGEEFKALMADYHKFLSDNPTVAGYNHPAPDAETHNKSIKNWMKIFMNTGDMIKNYKFPDIDYSDPAQLKQHEKELYMLGRITMDYNQELDRFMQVDTAKKLETVEGGANEYLKKRFYFDALQSTCNFLQQAFFNSPVRVNAPTKAYVLSSAAQRRAFLKESENLKGKTVGQYLDEKPGNIALVTYSMNLQSKIATNMDQLSEQEATDYLTGNGNAICAKLDEYVDEVKADMRKQFNTAAISRATLRIPNAFPTEVKNQFRTSLATLTQGNPDAIDFYMRVIGEQGNTVRDLTEKNFNEFYKGNGGKVLSLLNKDAMDLVKIGGMTPDELWGRKYAFLDDKPKEKQMMYRIEFMRELYEGKTDITMDIYEFDENGKLYKEGVAYIAMKPATVIRLANLKEDIKSVNKFYKDALKTINDAEKELTENEKQSLLADEKYQNLKTKLGNILSQSNTSVYGPNLKTLFDALNEYKTAAKEYRDARSAEQPIANPSILAVKTAADGVAKSAAASTEKSIRELSVLSSNFRLMPLANEDPTDPRFTYDKIDNMLATQKHIREDNKDLLDNYKDLPKNKMIPSDDLAWAFPSDGPNNKDFFKEISNEKYYQLEKNGNGGMDLRAFSDKYLEHANDFKRSDPRHKGIGLSADRTPTTQSIFLLWVLGTKENYTVEKLKNLFEEPRRGPDRKILNQAALDERKTLIEEFNKFCEENPTAKAENDEKFKTAVGNWTEVFHKATEKMGQYKLPMIDYSDKDQVREHIEDFSLICKLCVDCCQELPNIIRDQSGKTITGKQAASAKKGEGAYDKILETWEKYQVVFDPIFQGYVQEFKAKPGCDFSSYIASVNSAASGRALCKAIMNSKAGKSVSDAAEEMKQSVHYQIDSTSAVINSLLVNPQHRPEYRDFLGYFLGRGNIAFEEKIAKIFEEQHKLGGKVYTAKVDDAFVKFTQDSQKIGLDFANVGDSVEDMRNYLNTPLPPDSARKTVRRAVEFAMESLLLNSYYHQLRREAGIKTSDCFRIGGKSPQELWGEKYRDVEDAEEREFLIQAEIVREAVKGEKRIELRQFGLEHIPGKYSLVIGDFAVVQEDPKMMKQLVETSRVYDVALEEYLRELKEIQQTLQSTQDDKRANLSTNKKREGSEYYQNMTVSLDKVIRALEKEVRGADNVTQAELEAMINDMQEKADIYFQNRKGHFIKPIHDYGRIRLGESSKIKEMTALFTERSKILRSGFGVEMKAGSDRVPLKDANSGNRRSFIEEMEKKANLQGQSRENDAKTLAKMAAIQQVAKMENKPVPAKPFPRKNYELSMRYLKKYVEKLSTAKNIDADINDLRRLDHLDDEMERLAGNHLFQSMMRKKPDVTIENWQKIEKDAAKKKDSFVKEIDDIKKNNGCFSRNIAGFANNGAMELNGKIKPLMDQYYDEVQAYKREHPGVKDTDPEVKKIAASCRKQREDQNYTDCEAKILRMNKKALKAAYEKLTKAVIAQVLSEDNEVSKLLRAGISADKVLHDFDVQNQANQPQANGEAQAVNPAQDARNVNQTYSDLATKALKTYLKGKCLEGENIGKTLRDLDSGKLKKDLIKELAKENVTKLSQTAQEDRQAEAAARNGHQNAHANIVNHP